MRRALPSGLVGLVIATAGVACNHEPDVVAVVGALQDGGMRGTGAAGTGMSAPATNNPNCPPNAYFGYLYPIVTNNCQVDPGILSVLYDIFAMNQPPAPMGEERPVATNGCDTQFPLPPPPAYPETNGDWFLCPRFCDYAKYLVEQESERLAACARDQASPP